MDNYRLEVLFGVISSVIGGLITDLIRKIYVEQIGRKEKRCLSRKDKHR